MLQIALITPNVWLSMVMSANHHYYMISGTTIEQEHINKVLLNSILGYFSSVTYETFHVKFPVMCVKTLHYSLLVASKKLNAEPSSTTPVSLVLL